MNNELREALLRIFIDAINEVGIENFKKMSMWGSNDPAIKAEKIKNKGL